VTTWPEVGASRAAENLRLPAALRLDGPEVGRIRARARRHGVHVSLGFTEGTDASVGCIWNSNVLICPYGAVLNLHRKLVPTFYEKLIWANGDARGR
jgi:nitrilase